MRLYFRPRTPTQHQIEGFRPAGQYGSLGKHMPLPVFFLFDSKDVLTREATRFSKGNLSQNPEVGEDATFFASIPFEKVYHDSWLQKRKRPRSNFIVTRRSSSLANLNWTVSGEFGADRKRNTRRLSTVSQRRP
ncbi:MAG: DarT ssDNA thymidine ADP-ribosyltransferase family protein [Limisphaerales bacterium]